MTKCETQNFILDFSVNSVVRLQIKSLLNVTGIRVAFINGVESGSPDDNGEVLQLRSDLLTNTPYTPQALTLAKSESVAAPHIAEWFFEKPIKIDNQYSFTLMDATNTLTTLAEPCGLLIAFCED